MNQALFRQALAALQAGNPRQTEQMCQRLLVEDGQEFDTLHLLGLARFQLGQIAAAVTALQGAIALNAGFAPAWSNLGMMEAAAGEQGKALACFEKALSLAPPMPELLVNLGNTLIALGRAAEALTRFEQALKLRPQMAEALLGRAKAQRELGAAARSLADCETALKFRPDSFQALCHKGIALTDLGRLSEALASFDAALALAPSYAEAAYSKAMVLLLQGDFAGGLPLYEARKRLTPPSGLRPYPQPSWLGREPIAGKTLFLYHEQGLGDVLMFSRFVAPLAAMGAKVILAVPEKLQALFRGFALKAEIITGEPAQFDFHAPLASLPLALGTRVETIPPPPALAPDPARAERWRERIGTQGFRIGIAWQGARNSADIGRSFPVARLAGIAALEGVRLISLQRGDGAEQLETLPPGMTVERLGAEFDAGPDAFVDAAAAMASLDLVISSDTAIAHLAGTMARPVWIALRKTPEWRWLLERQDSPWYPGARLFRQTAAGDWDGVFAAVAARLPALRA